MYRFIVFLALSTLILSAQDDPLNERWRWSLFTTESGLPSNRVRDVVETSDGRAWAVTESAVAWFDNYRWRTAAVPKDCLGKKIEHAFPGPQGDLCLVVDEKLFRGNAVAFRRTPIEYDGTDLSVVNAVTRSDKLLVLGRSIDAHKDTVMRLVQLSYDGHSTPFQFPEGVDGKGQRLDLWSEERSITLCAGNLLFRLEGATWSRTDRSMAPSGVPSGIFANGDDGVGAGRVFVSYSDAGMRRRRFMASGGRSSRGLTDPLRIVDRSSDGRMISICQSGAIESSFHGRWTRFDPPLYELVDAHFIRFRPNDDLWVGTSEGLRLCKLGSARWKFLGAAGQSFDTVYDILRTHAGEIWLGTDDGVRIYRATELISSIRYIGPRKLGEVTSINDDELGDVWVASRVAFQGAYRRRRERWRYFGEGTFLGSSFVSRISHMRSGELCFLLESRSGTRTVEENLQRADRGSPEDLSGGMPMRSRTASAVCQAVDGSEWLATDSGLTEIRNGTQRLWRNDALGMRSSIRFLTTDPDTNVWFSDGSQIGWIDTNGKTAIFAQPENSGHFDIQDMRSDSAGRQWLATRRGLWCFEKGIWRCYSVVTGLVMKDVSAVFPTGGNVIVGTEGRGAYILDPRDSRRPVLVEFDEPVINNDRAYLQWNDYAWEGSVSPEQIENRCRVDNGSWTAWGKSRHAYLVDLGEGPHTIIVQAKDVFGGYDPAGASLSLVIPPAFYLHPLFLWPVVVLSTCVAALLLVVFARLRRHTEEIKRDRDRIASDLHDEVGSNLGSIALISQRLRRQPQFPRYLRGDVLEITNTALATAAVLREIVWYVNPNKDSLGSLIYQMRDCANLFLRNIDFSFTVSLMEPPRNLEPEMRRNLYLMFKELLHNIVKHSNAARARISVSLDRRMLTVVVEDDGRGFDAGAESGGSGLGNIENRAARIRAGVQFDGGPESGTRCTITVPLSL